MGIGKSILSAISVIAILAISAFIFVNQENTKDNNVPTQPVVLINPDPAFTDDTLSCVVSIESTDKDDDNIEYKFEWFLNDTLTTITDEAVLPENTTVGDEWRCEVTPSDGIDDGPKGIATVEIDSRGENVVNSPPSAPVVSIGPNLALTTDDLICSVTVESEDVDNDDIISYSYEWTKNGISTTFFSNLVSANNTLKGETWSCTVTPNDGEEDGASGSDSITIGNSLPSMAGIEISPKFPFVNESLTCSITAQSTDPDIDIIEYSYSWFINDTIAGITNNIVNSVLTSANDVWHCEVTPSDGTDDGPTATSSVTIQDIPSNPTENTPPSAPTITLTPNPAFTNSDLTCTITVPSSDFDGDSVTYNYSWTVNSVNVGIQSSILASTYFVSGDTIICQVIPNDGSEDGNAAINSVTISNSVPTAPQITILPSTPSFFDDLSCSITSPSLDADGDSIFYSYSWKKNGTNSGITVSTVTFDQLAVDDVWECTVVPSDGIANGPNGTSSIVVQPISVSGTYTLDIHVIYFCAYYYGIYLVQVDLVNFVFSDNGATLSVLLSFNGYSMIGPSARDGKIDVSYLFSGGCDETYSLTGQFTGTDTWTGTFTAQYSGTECLDCTNQSWDIEGTRPSSLLTTMEIKNQHVVELSCGKSLESSGYQGMVQNMDKISIKIGTLKIATFKERWEIA